MFLIIFLDISHKVSFHKLQSFKRRIFVQPHCAHEWGRFACLLGEMHASTCEDNMWLVIEPANQLESCDRI